MESILTRCGYRCDLCLAYRPNVAQDDNNRQKLSDGWFKYFGFRIEPGKLICDGCMAKKDARLIDDGCPVRPCVIEKGMDNCAQCEEYICEKLGERIVRYEEVKQRLGVDIPDDDYQYFILPYENARRLETYRQTGKISK